jgi:hypothetical protein
MLPNDFDCGFIFMVYLKTASNSDYRTRCMRSNKIWRGYGRNGHLKNGETEKNHKHLQSE